MNGRNVEMKRNLRSFLGSLPFNRGHTLQKTTIIITVIMNTSITIAIIFITIIAVVLTIVPNSSGPSQAEGVGYP